MTLTAAGNWNLHGCKDLTELNAVIAELRAQRIANRNILQTNAQCYRATSEKLGVLLHTVQEVAVWYQSLWLD